MNEKNLALVFGPNLARPKEIANSTVYHVSAINLFAECLLVHQQELFQWFWIFACVICSKSKVFITDFKAWSFLIFKQILILCHFFSKILICNYFSRVEKWNKIKLWKMKPIFSHDRIIILHFIPNLGKLTEIKLKIR